MTGATLTGNGLAALMQIEAIAGDLKLATGYCGKLFADHGIKAKEVVLKQKHVKLFRKLLPPAKVTRFFQLENKLDAVVNFELAQTVPLTH